MMAEKFFLTTHHHTHNHTPPHIMNSETTPTGAPAATPAAQTAPAAASLAANAEKLTTILAGFVGRLVDVATRALSPKLIECSLAWARVTGQFAVLAGIVLALVYAIVAAVRYRSFAIFLAGLGLALAIVVAQYAAGRFLGSSDKTIANTPNRISSKAFLDCAGLLLLLGAVGVLAGGIYSGVNLSAAAPIVSAIVIAPLLALAGGIALNPGVVGIEIAECGAGEEAIGIASFVLKIWLKCVPVLFGLLAVAGCVVTIWSWFDSSIANFGLAGRAGPGGMALPFMDAFMVQGMAGPSLVLYACMIPVIVYLAFIFWSLALDLARAILSIPAKLDHLKK